MSGSSPGQQMFALAFLKVQLWAVSLLLRAAECGAGRIRWLLQGLWPLALDLDLDLG
jgi:hypothetical protein